MRPVVWSLLTYAICKLLVCLEQVHHVHFVCIYDSTQQCGIDFWNVFYSEPAQFSIHIAAATEDWLLMPTENNTSNVTV